VRVGHRMTRDMASQFARGHFTTNAEYIANLRSKHGRMLRRRREEHARDNGAYDGGSDTVVNFKSSFNRFLGEY